MAALSAEWLAAQRWFRAKQRPTAAVSMLDHASLGPVELRIVEVAYTDGGPSDQYFVPTLGGRDPGDDEGAWTAIVKAMDGEVELHGQHGTFVCSRTDALAALLPSDTRSLDERRLRVEQSNTSIVLGDRLILKLYRLLESGINPDLEVAAFLTDVGFADTPAVAGAMTYLPDGGQPAAAAMAQAFVPTTGDAWATMRAALVHDPDAAVQLAARIGELTARLHAALASRPQDPAFPAFPARAATVAETGAWRASAESQLAQAISAVDEEAHARLVRAAPAVSARFADTFGSATGEARVSRVHGDYHLGQLLARTDGGFSVIDFEGEPARPMSERRRPGSPLRDMAGMLRSLDYAARTVERTARVDAGSWLAAARGAFLGAYGGIGDDEIGLLEAFELEKACYEVRYEASNRPDRLWLPLAAVERLIIGQGRAS